MNAIASPLRPRGAPSPRVHTVRVVGFSVAERAALGSLFKLSSQRPVVLQYPRQASSYDILLVDGDAPQAHTALLQAKYSARQRVLVVASTLPEGPWPVLPRPIRWRHLLGVLEHLAVSPPQSLGRALREAPPVTAQEVFLDSVRDSCAAEAPTRRVMVCEPNDHARQQLQRRLARFDCRVDLAHCGEEAVGLTARGRYDCIFVGAHAPGLNGWQVGRIIRARQVAQRPALVLLHEGDSALTRWRGNLAGFDACLPTPLDDARLMPLLHQHLLSQEPEAQRVAQ